MAYYKNDNDLQNRLITDNSRKYEISSDSEEEAPDFNFLVSQHTSTGSHFVFKGEQEKFQGESLANQFSKYFNVDTKLLNLAIKSIPFNERHEIISGIEWSKEELHHMREEARNCEQAYKQLLESNLSKPEEKKVQKVTSQVEKLKIEEKKESAVSVEPPKSDDKKSMEKWLDDILDL